MIQRVDVGQAQPDRIVELGVALQQALSSRVLIITGGPGVGKTTLVEAFVGAAKTTA